jgi:hypothetical protein
VKLSNLSIQSSVGLFPIATIILCSSGIPADTRIPRVPILLYQVSGQTPKPYTLEDVKELVGKVKRDVFSVRQAVELIKQHKVTFDLSESSVTALTNLGADPQIVAAVKAVAPKPPPPPPPTVGSLTVICAPVDCDVVIDSQSRERTIKGQLTRQGLNIQKKIHVAVSQTGYMPKEDDVTIGQTLTASLSFKLEPTEETLAANGSTLFGSMVHTITADSDLRKLTSFAASGSLTSFFTDGQSSWDLQVNMEPPASVNMTVTNSASGTFQFSCIGETCADKKKKFLAKGNQHVFATELENNLRYYSRYHIGALLEAIKSEAVKFSSAAAEDAGGSEQRLHIETKDADFLVVVGPDLLPNEVTYKEKSGLIEELKVTYGDYQTVGSMRYPRRTTIRLPGSRHQGIEVRFSTIVLVTERPKADPKK